ncbi:hypothetical protein, partial [Faecalibaculum rodentium]|uniref:hypothetical protein n=1 Tax=Faecalibaculum rodentium TaxID=1702221 RepID=UPI003F4D289A
ISLKQQYKLERLKELVRKHPNLTLVLAASDTEDILDAWKVESAAFLRGKRNPARLASVVRDVQARVDEQKGH